MNSACKKHKIQIWGNQTQTFKQCVRIEQLVFNISKPSIMTFFYYTAALSETEILCTDLSHMLSPNNIQCTMFRNRLDGDDDRKVCGNYSVECCLKKIPLFCTYS